MAKTTKRKKRKLVLPNKKLLIVSGVVLAAAIVYGVAWLAHNHAITQDKNRFARAGNDVQTVANAIVATVGQPADRKDGGKCSYAHQEFSKGPLSCEVYSYLAYGVSSPDDVNAIVQKVDPLAALHGTPWKFKAVTEKPHQFVDGVNYSDNFVPLANLFDTEVKNEVYHDGDVNLDCAISYLYQNSIASLSGYPQFSVNTYQLLLFDVDCVSKAKSPYFSIIN